MRSDPSYSSRQIPTDSPSYNVPGTARRYRWLQVLLLVGFSLFASISIVALITLWWFFGSTATPAIDSALDLPTEEIRPGLALMYLAGDPADALATQALEAGEYTTSQALLFYGVHAMPNPRIALVLQLSQRFQEIGATESALQLLHKGRSIAILDTALSPLERADALLFCATNFLALGEEAAAVDAAKQVQRIAEQTPDMLPAIRSRLLQDLLPLANQLPDETLRQQIRELIRNPYISPPGIVIQEPLPFADGSIEFEQQLTLLIQSRQQLSRQLAERILQSPIANTDPLIDSLAQALRAEDEQRSLYFNQLFASESLTFSLQFWFVNEHRRWLILKLAIANRALGLSLVPEWEANQAELIDDLIDLTDLLQTEFLTLAQSQPEPLQQLSQRIAIMRWFALQAEVGLYPQRSVEINERLRVAQNELAQLGTRAALAVSYHLDAEPPGFRIDTTR